LASGPVKPNHSTGAVLGNAFAGRIYHAEGALGVGVTSVRPSAELGKDICGS